MSFEFREFKSDTVSGQTPHLGLSTDRQRLPLA